MDKKELKKKLILMGVPSHDYDLEGDFTDQAMNLLKNGDKWEVFFCERGGKAVLKTFDTESEACEYMLEELRPSGIGELLPFLPVGSVVRLEGGNVNLVIVARALLATDKNGRKVYYDYGAFPYPHGLVNKNMAYFQQEAIEEVLFTGLINDQEKQMVQQLLKFKETYKEVPRGKRDSLA